MSPPNLSKPMLVRCAGALVAAAVAIAWIPPRDRYTAVGALLTAVGAAGLVLFVKRSQLWRMAIEVPAAIVGGLLCVGLGFPARGHGYYYVVDVVLPNWESGITFGWLLAAIGTRLFEVDWSKVRLRPIQFSLMRLLGSMSLVAASLSAALHHPSFIDDRIEFAVAVSLAVVCGAAAVGLLVERAGRFAYYATVIMAALSAPVILQAMMD
jgi:hypothetical protein